MAGDGATDGTEHGCDVIAAAAAEPVAENAADHAACDSPAARGLAGLLDLADFLDYRALTAGCSRDRRRRNDRGRWLGRGDCLGLRRIRGALGRRRLRGLRWLCGSPGKRSRGIGLRRCRLYGRGLDLTATDRRRDPAENGSDADEAEHRQRDGGDNHEGMGVADGRRLHGILLLRRAKRTLLYNARGADRLM